MTSAEIEKKSLELLSKCESDAVQQLLTPWEITFLNSNFARRDQGFPLRSEKVLNILERIVSRTTQNLRLDEANVKVRMAKLERPVTKISLTVHGARDFPLQFVKLPDFIVKDLADLVDEATALNPTVTVDEVVKAIWRLGSRRLHSNMVKGIAPTKEQNLPPLVDTTEKEEESKGDSTRATA